MEFRTGARYAACVAALLLGGVARPTHAQFVGYLKTEHQITAGLDESTRRLIEGLPAEAKAQALALLADSLPLIDKSVNSYLDKVDEILNGSIDRLMCGGQGLAKGTVEQITAALLNRRPTPLVDLQRNFDEREKNFPSKPLSYLAVSYEDYLVDTATTACQTKDAPAQRRIDQLRATARPRWRVWNELAGQCDTPSGCLNLRYGQIKALVAASERRDLDKAQATTAFAAVDPQPKVSVGFFAALVRQNERIGPWVVYEDELLKLRNVEQAVVITRETRLSAAASVYAQAISALESKEAEGRQARASLSTTNRVSNNNAVTASNAVEAGLTPMSENLTFVDASSLQANPLVMAARTRIESLRLEIAAIRAVAVSNGPKITDFERKVDEAVRARAQREADKADKRPR